MKYLLSLLALALTLPLAHAEEMPKVLDDRLKLELIAESPIVRTPTGMAIDEKGRVYVIESHTHFRPNGYDGPKHDRILRFEKKEDKYEPSVFFEGTTHTMNCGFHPDGSLYVATRMEVFKLVDKNDNGKIEEDERTRLAHLDTPGNYPHNGLSGFAFDFAGNVYFGFGENLGASYKLIGSDGTTLSGGGEGGNVYCMKADGSQLRRVATGFWNPFHLYMDPFGRLFTVDNDPDSRPPCRLIHVVEGGDYGYRFRNGRKGTHPFTSWFGELPGTLPMVSGTGEAPSGVISYSGWGEMSLGDDYQNRLLVTSWGDHRIESYELKPRGASFQSVMKPVVVGDDRFRPVGIAEAPDGTVWFTDWVDKSYQLHGRGRLWRLSPKVVDENRATAIFTTEVPGDSDKTEEDPIGPKDRASIIKESDDPAHRAFALGGYLGTPPRLPDDIDVVAFTNAKHNPAIRYAATRRLDPVKDRKRLNELLGDPDPFIQQAARYALRPIAETLGGFGIISNPDTRLGIALVLREANTEVTRKQIPEMLHDADPRVRFVAIQWVGEERLKDVWSEWKNEVERQIGTRQELEAYLATSAFLSDEKYDPGKESAGEEFVARMLLDKNTKPERQAFLVRMLRADHPALTEDRLEQWFKGDNAQLRLAALQIISQRGQPPRFLNINDLAQDENRPVEERLEAISLLSPVNPNYVPLLVNLAKSDDKLIASQAERSLRLDERVAASHSLAVPSEGRPQPADTAAWLKRLDQQPGDAKAGGLVFHHQIAQCSRCHEVAGRGAAIGPNLTGIGRTMTRERLIQSILQPSKEIAPQFAVWQLETTDGRILKGMYVGEEVDGTVIYADEQGRKFKLHPRDVESRTQQPQSIMPEGLVQRLADQEIRDLLAYLSR